MFHGTFHGKISPLPWKNSLREQSFHGKSLRHKESSMERELKARPIPWKNAELFHGKRKLRFDLPQLL